MWYVCALVCVCEPFFSSHRVLYSLLRVSHGSLASRRVASSRATSQHFFVVAPTATVRVYCVRRTAVFCALSLSLYPWLVSIVVAEQREWGSEYQKFLVKLINIFGCRLMDMRISYANTHYKIYIKCTIRMVDATVRGGVACVELDCI